MGKLLYGTPPTSHDIEDRLLAHLQIVIVNKYRRNESFVFNIDASHLTGTGRHALWLHPSIPIQFAFNGSRMPVVNPDWVHLLMETSNSGRGLHVVLEPPTPSRGSMEG